MLSKRLYPSGIIGSTGLVFQFINPTIETSAKANTMSTERTVLTFPTSFIPNKFITVKIKTIPILSTCSDISDIGIS